MRLCWLLGLCLGILAEEIQINPGCPPGMTGPSCLNPICPFSVPFTPHDGEANRGDTIALFHSMSCRETFSFAVDNHMPGVYIVVVTSASETFPVPNLYDPAGNQLPDSGMTRPSTTSMTVYFDLPSEETPRGLYALAMTNQQDGECRITVTSKTDLTVDGGFVVDRRDDNVIVFDPVDNQAIGRDPTLNTSTYLAFKVQKENFPVQAMNVRIMREGYDDQVFELDARYNCSAPHITRQPFNCSAYANYHAEFTGNDEGGNPWQRIYDFICIASAVTQTPPTGTPFTPPPQDSCLNGGTLSPSGTCWCGEFFEGIVCEWKLCMNGGTLNIMTDECLCANGWSGEFCEHVHCTTVSDDRFYRVNKALGFVVRSATSMAAQMSDIITAASTLTDAYPNFQVYVLSVVQNGELYFTNYYDTPAAFITALKGISHPPVDTVCSDALLAGVNGILDLPEFQAYPDSPIYVFSDGVLNDGVSTMGYALQQLSLYRPQLYFILSDSVNGLCNVDISAEGYQTLLGFSAFSQGLAIKTDLNKLTQTVSTITETVFGTSVLAQNDLLDCRQAPQYQPFFVDESIRAVWIAATGNNLTLTLTLPDLTTRTPIVYYATGNFQLWLLNSPMTGAYMVNLKSRDSGATECSYRVHAETIFAAYFGATTDLLTDRVGRQPIFGQDTHLVARIHNVYKPDPIDISTEITLWTNDINSGRVVLYSSSGIWRDECAYDLYFGSFQCPVPGMGFYVSIYITDNHGYTVLRTLTGYCSASLPPSPGEQCQNGGATFNGTCFCPLGFSGDRCENIHCQNQGTAKFATCICPPGFAGQFCENAACLQTNQFVFSDPDHRSLTFLMHDTITTRSVFRTINDVAARIIHDVVHQHPRWFGNYQLVRFNDTDYQSLTDSSNPEDFIKGINTAYNYNQQNSDYSCSNLDLYRTLLTSLRDQNVAYGGVFYIFLYGMPRPDSDSYDQIITHLEGSQIQVNVVQFSLNPCGQDYTKDGLMALAQASGGTYFLSSGPNAGNVVKSLPTVHQSGLIFERFVDNCADETFFVPVDANTQSITAYIQGELNGDPVYTKPDGSVADRLSVNNVWSDIGSDSRMDQIIQTCDNGWFLSDGHCYYFHGKSASWQDAQNFCQGVGATLATVYSQPEQTALNFAGQSAKFWIGLNDLVDLNQWVWALPNNQAVTLNTTRYTNWGAGQPTSDVSKRCALEDNLSGDKGWFATDCSESHYFACSKDTYNTEFEPGDNGNNMVPRGVWSIRVKADGPCSIQLRAQSSLQVQVLYTTSIHSDFGAFEPLQGTGNNRLIAHVSGLRSTTTRSLEYGHVYSDDGKLLQAQTITHRDGSCTYDYISTPFQCVNSAFQMMLTGVDSFGYAYQRVIPVLCLGAPDASSCENGGTFYDGFCVCPPNFFVILCQNNGYAGGSLGTCVCPDNFQGRFCELPRCTRGGVVPDISQESRTFILSLDGSSSGNMAPVLGNISTTLTTLLNGLNTSNKDWFTSYVAVVFRDSQSGTIPVFSNTIYDTDYTSWIAKIVDELQKNVYVSKQTSRAVFGGLSQALSHPSVKENSFAFVLTNSNAEDIRNEDMVLSATARTHTSIYFIFVGDDTAPGGGNDYTDPTVADLFEAAHNSGGSAYQVATSASLGDIWLRIIGTLRNSYTVISHHLSNCKSYTDYIQLGSNGTELIVDVAQGQPTVTVTNAKGANVRPVTLFASKTNILTEFAQTGLDPGVWGITIKGTGDTCMFNVRGQSDLQVLAAFTQDVATDAGLHDGSATAFPKAMGWENAVVATVMGAGTLTHVQMLDIEEHSLLWASPLIQRALCPYSYISTQLFICDRPSFIMAVDGLDAVGHPFRRLLTFHCQGFIPPTPPSKPTTPSTAPTSTVTPYPPCDLSTVTADFIFVMDSSDGIANEEFNKILGKFGPSLFDNLNLNITRLVLANYDVNANFHNSTFDSIKTEQDLASHFINIALLGYSGVTGNNIDAVLSQIGNGVLAATPFRDETRKIVTFLSTIGWNKGNSYDGAEHGFTDPTIHMNALKSMGAEFIPIAYGEKADMNQLLAFSANCTQHAGSLSDFDRIVSYIQWNLCQTLPQC